MLILSVQEEGTPRIHFDPFCGFFHLGNRSCFSKPQEDSAPGPAPDKQQRDSLRHGDLLGSWRHCDNPWLVDELLDSTKQELGQITIHPKLSPIISIE